MLSFTRIVGAAAPEMKKAGYGRVLTIASSSIKQPIPNLALSNALRAGVWGIAKTLSRELAPQGILVNVIAPGRIDTERIAELDQANAQKSGRSIEDVRKASVAGIPLGRLGKPEELANLVVFLASEAGSYITGQAITVDGAAGNAREESATHAQVCEPDRRPSITKSMDGWLDEVAVTLGPIGTSRQASSPGIASRHWVDQPSRRRPPGSRSRTSDGCRPSGRLPAAIAA